MKMLVKVEALAETYGSRGTSCTNHHKYDAVLNRRHCCCRWREKSCKYALRGSRRFAEPFKDWLIRSSDYCTSPKSRPCDRVSFV